MRVHGVGSVPARVAFIGEYPGLEEARTGVPFSLKGRSGRELSRFLDGESLPRREDVWLTNLVREFDQRRKGVDQDEIDRDWPELCAELEAVQPEVLVTAGSHVTRYFLGDVTLEATHGIPHVPQLDRPFYNGMSQAIVFPCYNPAAGLRSPELQALFAYDMQRLGLLLKGKLEPAPVDHLTPVYREKTGGWQTWSTVAIDTEGSVKQPWCLSHSFRPGHAVVIRHGQGTLDTDKAFVVLHNALHDLAVLRAMNIYPKQYTDTMIMAYLLGLEPQGLKPLAYRHAGMKMDDYADITAEASERIAREWLTQLTDGTVTHRQLGSKPDDLEKTLRLVDRMLKPNKRPLRARWQACAARERLEPAIGKMPEATLDDVPLERAIHYAARDADATLRIFPVLDKQIDAMGLRDVLNADLAILPMVDRMQQVGLPTDMPYFKDLSVLFGQQFEDYNGQLARHAGHPINTASGDQVSDYLFGELKLPWKKKTRSGKRPTTDDKTLEALRKDERIPEKARQAIHLIQEVREIQKLKGTYADKIPGLVAADGRLHPRLRLTRTGTGRLSAGEPNLLAFPKHSERGLLIRGGFLAPLGSLLGEWDLDQIEMRIMAIDSRDRRMLAEFLSGADKHTATACLIFGKAAANISKEERFAAKTVNFGVLMGMTEYGLLDQFHKNGQFHWTLEDSVRLLRDWHRSYPDASAYIYEKHAEARRYGYVRDLWGRLRYLVGVHSTDRYIEEEALRQAQATPIQSGAQGCVKRWMAAVWDAMQESRWPLMEQFPMEPLLQVHDALMFEFPVEKYKQVGDLVLGALEAVQVSWGFPIPITAKGDSGLRWSDL